MNSVTPSEYTSAFSEYAQFYPSFFDQTRTLMTSGAMNPAVPTISLPITFLHGITHLVSRLNRSMSSEHPKSASFIGECESLDS